MTASHPRTLHECILEARNAENRARYKAKVHYYAYALAGIPDHRTNDERQRYARMMARRVFPSLWTVTRYQKAVAAYLRKNYRQPLQWPMGAGRGR